jgi:hypothetical protein
MEAALYALPGLGGSAGLLGLFFVYVVLPLVRDLRNARETIVQLQVRVGALEDRDDAVKGLQTQVTELCVLVRGLEREIAGLREWRHEWANSPGAYRDRGR